MRFFIVDDDDAIRSILSQIIEDGDLGEVVGEASDGDQLTGPFLNMQKVDILFVDLLMPVRDGIETIRHLDGQFKGKIIMISQVESKELISEAYALGVEYYIMKPINRIEIVTVIRKVVERIQLEKSIQEIKTSLSSLLNLEDQTVQSTAVNEKSIANIGEFLLAELGIVGENGSRDLIDILKCLFTYEHAKASEQNFPSLKEIFKQVAQKRLGSSASEKDINRETKASEQRIRRAITHSLIHFASLGLTDYANPKFENYASKFFDFMVVRQKMREIQEDSSTFFTPTKVNTKKFIQVFFFEAKRLYKDI
ncbi:MULTISPECIES: response regulator [Bacillaceae]|uniref:Transcriptional regulator n=1 Tax=Domibacillus aminovorans TaxID=29332 RepID=A0A177KRX6_9BACI|nr:MULTISPECIES: response regulator [Bacillaceae]OAH55826.1 transcriptional regulator [Domibacillus aminovorans]